MIGLSETFRIDVLTAEAAELERAAQFAAQFGLMETAKALSRRAAKLTESLTPQPQ